MSKHFYRLLEPVFAVAHSGTYPIEVDNIVSGVKKVDIQGNRVTEVAFHPVKHFSDVIGVLEKVKVAYSPDIDEFVAHVHYREGENYCWERFAKSKEICQSIIGPATARTFKASEISILIDEMIAPFLNPGDTSEGTEWDRMGVIAACEMLFPMKDRHFYLAHWNDNAVRQGLCKMIEAQEFLEFQAVPPRSDFDPSGPMSQLLAFAYRIPQVYIDAILSPRGALACWKMARKENPARFDNIQAPTRRTD